MNDSDERGALRRLARLWGVQLDYTNLLEGRPVTAGPEPLLAVLGALGAPIESVAGAPEALRRRRIELWSRVAPASAVAWDGAAPALTLRIPHRLVGARWRTELVCEDGPVRRQVGSLAELPTIRMATVEGERFLLKRLALPLTLTPGYHRLLLELPDRRSETLIISAPRRAWRPEGDSGRRDWGVFLPLYALRTRSDWGVGDLGDFQELADWVHGRGGGVVAALPMLAGFMGAQPHEPSPYAPASRLFWNELYVDIDAIPELERCRSARDRLQSEGFQSRLAAVRGDELVNYRDVLALKRVILDELAEAFYADPGQRAAEYLRFVQSQPQIEDYAQFRAVNDRLGRSWWTWPEPLRGGRLQPGDWLERDRQYHLYAQFIADEQFQRLGKRLAERGHGLYLDMPLGASSDSYDVWRERDLFAAGASGGAPPDGFFALGQDWGFPPLHPIRLREQGFRYEIGAVRQLMRAAGMVRIDHVMGLHRLFWVPRGFKPTEGVYVRYPTEERFAILTLESHRMRTTIVGEDLGTVPAVVRRQMNRHDLRRMYVMQFMVKSDPRQAVEPPLAGMIAHLNTHDTPTFKAFWDGLDLELRREMGLLDDRRLGQERGGREQVRRALVGWFLERGWLAAGEENDPLRIMEACYRTMASSPAGVVLVNLEDLWLEPRPQNVPGTGPERPNWRRRAARRFEEFRDDAGINRFLADIDKRRKNQG